MYDLKMMETYLRYRPAVVKVCRKICEPGTQGQSCQSLVETLEILRRFQVAILFIVMWFVLNSRGSWQSDSCVNVEYRWENSTRIDSRDQID